METNLSLTTLQAEHKEAANNYLVKRGCNNPEFAVEFGKTFADMLFSQSDDMLAKISATRQQSLFNAVYRATEAGASFAKKEVSFIPFEIMKTEKKDGVERKTKTGEYDALVIFDINFQKQQIMKMENCKKFYTAEVHEGVEVMNDLSTGNYIFDGKNDVTKPTIGYYSCFVATNGETYDIFMTCTEIVDRAKFSPGFKAENYKKTGNSIHYEKIVVRNLIKVIPKVGKDLSAVLETEDVHFSDYEEVVEKPVNALDAAKKAISAPSEEPKPAKKPAKKVEEANVVDSEPAESNDGEDYF